jgi:hypothetical protein
VESAVKVLARDGDRFLVDLDGMDGVIATQSEVLSDHPRSLLALSARGYWRDAEQDQVVLAVVQHAAVRKDFNPDQPRDEKGMWTSGGIGGRPAAWSSGDGSLAGTPEEGRAFAKDSQVTQPVYHLGSTDNAAVMRDGMRSASSGKWGAGVYFGLDPVKQMSPAVTGVAADTVPNLQTAYVNVQNLLTVNLQHEDNIADAAIEYLPDGQAVYDSAIAASGGRGASGSAEDPAKYYSTMQDAFKAAGYDGLRIQNTYAGPSAYDWLVVFDPKDVMVVSSRPAPERSWSMAMAKYSEDQPRDEHGRWASGGGASTKLNVVDVGPDTNSPAWKRVEEDIRAQGSGNCYDAAVTLAMNADELGLQNVRIIQATVMGRGELEGVRFGHSWVEADGQGVDHPQAGTVMFRNAYDWSSGNSVVMPDALYRHLGQAQDVHEYTTDEAIGEMVRTGFYGPWTEGTPMAGARDWKNSGPTS